MANPIRHRIVGEMVTNGLEITRGQEQPRVSSMLQHGSVVRSTSNKTSLRSPANLRTNPFTRSEEGSRRITTPEFFASSSMPLPDRVSAKLYFSIWTGLPGQEGRSARIRSGN